MIILCLLPLACIMLMSEVLKDMARKPDNLPSHRTALLYSILITGTYCVAITEILSYFHLIDMVAVFLCWAIPAAALGIYCTRKNSMRQSIKSSFLHVMDFGSNHKLTTLTILVFLLISLFIAIAYPPNNYDSMTYHLARVAHWQQNHSIGNYQTHINRQLIYPPFAEWIILHLQILTGGDRLANAVQLFFFAGSMITVSLIVKELGGTKQQQIFSALFTCLIPMAIIQSNTTQNDIVAGFFVTAFVYLALRIIKSPSAWLICMSGAALGLAWLTKGTSMIYTCLFCCWVAIAFLVSIRAPFKKIAGKLALYALIPVIAVAINSGHFHRNDFLTGSYLGRANEGTANEGFELKPIAMVGIKDFLNHMPVSPSVKHATHKLANSWDIDINDTKYNLTTMEWMMVGFSFHEDYAQNFVHTLLFLLALAMFFFNKRTYKNFPDTRFLFVATLFATCLLYIILLKWQPWANRLQTSLYFLICAVLAIQLPLQKKWSRAICFAALLATAIPALLLSSRHPLLPVSKSIFKNDYASFIYDPGMLECKKYIDSTRFKKLGLIIGKDSWDYPFYKLFPGLTLEHVRVNNESSIYPNDFLPEAILSLDKSKEEYIWNGITYCRTRMFENGGPAVYEQKPADQTSP